MHTLLSGFALVAAYGIFMLAVVRFFAGGRVFTKLDFLVAKRKIPMIFGAVSIAAAWIWAPALFVSAQKAYTQGWVGLFWFIVPNVLCLVLFAFFAGRIRALFPDGFTLSGYMRQRYSPRVQKLYLVELTGLAACSFAVQLVAGGAVIVAMTGMPYLLVIILLAVIPLAYTFTGGLRASIVSDFVQMAIIGIVGVITIPWAIHGGGGLLAIENGLFGKSGTFTELFSGDGLNVFLTFGIPTTIGLMSGPFGDQSFWQRAFGIERRSVKRAFLWSSVIFAVVPLSMSLLGFLAAGNGMKVVDAGHVNMEVVQTFLPTFMAVPFLFLLLSGLVSKLDTNLSAIASLAGHDLVGPTGDHEVGQVRAYSRGAMIVLSVAGIAIAYTIGTYVENPVVYLFLVYGTLRSSTLLPTIITLLQKDAVSESGVFWGIVVSLLVGFPIFAYGNLLHLTPYIVGGSLFTVLASGVITLLGARTSSVRIA